MLGLGWSRAALETAAQLRRLPACAIVQLTGALTSPDVTANLIESVGRLARLGGGRGYPFYAPLFVTDPASVDVITRQAEVADAFAQFSRVTIAVVGIGSWQPVNSNLHDALTDRGARRAASPATCSPTSPAPSSTPPAPRSAMPLSRQIIAIDAERLRGDPGRHLRRLRPAQRGRGPHRGARRLREDPRHHRGLRPGTAPEAERRMITVSTLPVASTAS